MFFTTRKSKQRIILEKPERQIKLKKDILDSILSYCRMNHPDEGF